MDLRNHGGCMNQDHRITAYALGELQGRERDIFETELAASDSLDVEAGEIFRLAKRLSGTPKPKEHFTAAERSALVAKCMQKQRTRKLLMLPVKIIGFSALGALGAAASLMLLAVLSGPWLGSGPWANGAYYPGVVDGAPFVSAASQSATARSALPSREFNTEAYAAVREIEFVAAKENPLSTFSIDVDTASYSNVRRFLDDEMRPPAGAVRTEELINYFRYDYPQPTGDDPFSVNLEVSRATWNPERELVRIGLKGRELPAEERGPANLVFLIDVSGSMDEPNKLPLLQRSLSALVENLSEKDRVAIVTYAGSSGLVLAPTEGAKKREILDAIGNLRAGGSTHGSEGIRLAYETAREQFREDGNNRVILCTDGDFNVGVTNESELQKLIERERESGVFLSVLGFGTGNLNDSTMELLANKGNGNYAYIDSISEGRKVLVEQMGSTLFTIAKDVKIQV